MKNHDNNVTGVIQLINKKIAGAILPFDSIDEMIMNSLAGQAAVALENNLLYRDMQQLLQEYRQQNDHLILLSKKVLKADEEERKRIAREIHDGPAQSVVNLSFKLEISKRYLADSRFEELAGELNNLGESIHSTVREIRTIIYDLKPSSLENGLFSAIRNHTETFSMNTGLNVDFKSSGKDSRVEYYLTSTVFRIVQEALSNVNKHANAQNVTIRLAIKESEMLLTIADDGKGFDPEEVKTRKFNKLQGGFGLDGIGERAELVRGGMKIESAPGRGTKLILNIPLF
jgi:two-component system sensor histidine kinase DegS